MYDQCDYISDAAASVCGGSLFGEDLSRCKGGRYSCLGFMKRCAIDLPGAFGGAAAGIMWWLGGTEGPGSRECLPHFPRVSPLRWAAARTSLLPSSSITETRNGEAGNERGSIVEIDSMKSAFLSAGKIRGRPITAPLRCPKEPLFSPIGIEEQTTRL
jgi:hypothetical protein